MIKRIWNGTELLERRKNITKIKDYRMQHKGKYPPEKCSVSMKNLILGGCNNSMYDYDTELDSITMIDLSTIIIKKYHSEYRPMKECFAVKYLSLFTQFPLLREVDEYYVEYRKQLPQKIASARARSASSTITSSCCIVGNGEESGEKSARNNVTNVERGAMIMGGNVTGPNSNSSSYLGTATTPVMKHSILRDSGKKPGTPLHNQLRLSSMMKSSIKYNNLNIPSSPANAHTSLTRSNVMKNTTSPYKTSLQRVETQNSNYINLFETIPENNLDSL